MEQLTPIVLLILWLIVSFLNNKKKQTAKPAPRPMTTSRPQESDLEEMLKDIFGKKEEPAQGEKPVAADTQKVPEFFEPVVEMQEDTVPGKAYQERELTTIEQAFEETGQDYKSFDTVQTILPETTLEASPGLEALESNYQFSAETSNLVSLEDAHALLEKARELPEEEIEVYQEEEFEPRAIREFNAQDAVLFSEILNRKYS